MIDIHTHILPGMDDGPATIAESLELMRRVRDSGTKTVAATPHVLNRFDAVQNDVILQNYGNFKEILESELPDLTVLPGSEIYFQPNLSDIVHLESATLNGTGRYLLTEFPFMDIPRGFERELTGLVRAGIIPIVAHPERNGLVINQPALVGKMVEAGALIQLNAGSLTGAFGRTVKKVAHCLLKRGWVHFIASDTHGLNHRGPDLQAAVDAAAEVIGAANASRLVRDNPECVICGLPLRKETGLETIAGGKR